VTIVQDAAAPGQQKRCLHVLLDNQNGPAFLGKAPANGQEVLDDQGRQSLKWCAQTRARLSRFKTLEASGD
jgi:hypothetical protein